ncbi:putative metabolite transport protein HI_1104 [Folsomia candida]|uniref:D-xylose-proton symporter n=1 Tax=Folsomia candida TaxID=158441 RepID=A0A226E560_FOLCA|nr:putative metabolite transport protein HI_1104 [Folsomia candida]OXA52097.1 D-xylose-proton symporter [Folsomia candida]
MESEGQRDRAKSMWMIAILASVYLNGELGHYLIGVVSRNMAQDLHFGAMACFPLSQTTSFQFCAQANTSSECVSLQPKLSGNESSHFCKWDYSGLGMDYQILAGPSFMAVFTVAGVLWGLAADKFNRVWLLFLTTVIFSSALAATSLATSFWHLVIFRILLGIGVSGCSPLAAGMICDSFHQQERGKAMSVYNCGMYVGYGLSYAVGIYVTAADIFGMGWRATFVICGIPGLVLALLLILTVDNPESPEVEDPSRPNSRRGSYSASRDASYSAYESLHSVSVNAKEFDDVSAPLLSSNHSGDHSPWRACLSPVIVLLVLAACLRRSAGYTLRYNSALYFQVYYPSYDVGWWLTGIYCIGGVAGSILGGITSDRLVNRLGVSARAIVLAVGQLIATPFAIGMLYLDPPMAFIPQSIGYLFGAMWFGALFTILVELVPPSIRSSAFGVAFFVMENVGGNFPVVVEYITSLIDYKTALAIMYPGELLASSAIFFVCYILLQKRRR